MACKEWILVLKHFAQSTSYKYLKFLKPHYQYVKSALIDRFIIHVKIDGKKYAVYADAAIVDVSIRRHIVKNTLNTKPAICRVCPLSTRTINISLPGVCQIEFTSGGLWRHILSPDAGHSICRYRYFFLRLMG